MFENIRKFLTYILAHNVPELVLYLALSLFPIPLPAGCDRSRRGLGDVRLRARPRGWSYGERLAQSRPLYLQATTACLSAVIVMQIVNVSSCRSASRSVLSTELLGNPLILWGVVLEIVLVLLIDYTSSGNLILGTAPIRSHAWLFIAPLGVGLLVLEELRKQLVGGAQR